MAIENPPKVFFRTIIVRNMRNESVLEIRDVSKIYKTKGAFFGSTGKDVTALNRISFDIFKG